jgi:hypothetical protein
MPYETVSLLKHGAFMESWFTEMEALSPLHRRIVLRRMRANKKLPLPRLLYRFQSLRRTVNRKPHDPVFIADSIERLRVPVVHSLLALRSPTEFNDPFDMGANIQIGGTDGQKRSRYRGMFEAFNPHGKLSEREAWVAAMLTKSKDELLPRIEKSHRNAVRDFGVICFVGGDKFVNESPAPESPTREYPARDILMWSHYGAAHSGICLQFDPSLDVRVFAHAVTVDYCDAYPTIDWIVDFHGGIGRAILRKHTRWRYEHEQRISMPDAAGKFLPFRPEALRGMILGCRVNADVEGAVADLLAERADAKLPPVRLYRAAQNRARYKLDIRKVAAHA